MFVCVVSEMDFFFFDGMGVVVFIVFLLFCLVVGDFVWVSVVVVYVVVGCLFDLVDVYWVVVLYCSDWFLMIDGVVFLVWLLFLGFWCICDGWICIYGNYLYYVCVLLLGFGL